MKHVNWFLVKVIYDILSQEMVEFVDITDNKLSVTAQLGFKSIEVSINRVFLPKVTSPSFGEYEIPINLTTSDGYMEQHTYRAEDFDEETLGRIAEAVYKELWTPAYKTWEEYLAWEKMAYENIF